MGLARGANGKGNVQVWTAGVVVLVLEGLEVSGVYSWSQLVGGAISVAKDTYSGDGGKPVWPPRCIYWVVGGPETLDEDCVSVSLGPRSARMW